MTGENVAAIILTFQSRSHIEECLAALRGQTVAVAPLFVDNASTDGGPELARSLGVRVVEMGWNAGYAAAHDRALEEVREPFVLFLNPDCRLEPDYVERALETLRGDSGLAGVQGKLVKSDGRLDSTGIVLTRSRRNFDRGEGEPDRGQFAPGEVFGISGAAALYRREALDDVAILGEALDASYWMYREDLDLCWRARLLGWKFAYDPRAVARHARGFGRGDRSRVSPALRHASLRNRYLTIAKNDGFASLLRSVLFLAVFELAQLVHALLREPRLLAAYIDFLKRLPDARRKRREIERRRRVSRRELERWFVAPRDAGCWL